MNGSLQTDVVLLFQQKHAALVPFLSLAPLETLRDLLEEYLTENRKQKIDDILSQRLQSLHVACESPTDIHNALAIVRSAEAFGVTNINIIDHELRKNEGRGTMQGSGAWSTVQFFRTLSRFTDDWRPEKGILVGMDPHATTSITEVPVERPLCLFFGNEQRGLTDEAKAACDMQCTIPMHGMTESFNLSVAAAIALYEITKRKRAFLQGKQDISNDEKLAQTVKAYIRTLGYEQALKIVKTLTGKENEI